MLDTTSPGLLSVREARAHAQHYETRFRELVAADPALAEVYEECRGAMEALADAFELVEAAVRQRQGQG